MQFTPYLNFNGNCAEAFAFYASIFNGQVIEQFTFDEMPDGPPVPAEAKHQIMHACLQIGEQILMGSDAFPSKDSGYPYHWLQRPKGKQYSMLWQKAGKFKCHMNPHFGQRDLAWSRIDLARRG